LQTPEAEPPLAPLAPFQRYSPVPLSNQASASGQRMTQTLDRREFAAALIAPFVAGAVSTRSAFRWPVPTTPAAINPPAADFLSGLPRLMEIAGVPGIAMSVVQERRVAWQHYEGVMDASTGQSVTADTLWPAASLGKPVFAFAALRLADDGRLDLDKPLKSYVPDHAPADVRGDKITARHVLSHTSGLRNWRNRPDQPLVPDFEPGSRFQYSGEGFYYLQRAVEHILNIGFEQFMEARLFTPLGMTASTYAWRADVAARLVAGHDRGQPRVSPSRDLALRLLSYAEQKNKPFASFTYEDILEAMRSVAPDRPTMPDFMIPNAAATLLTTPTDYGAYLVELLSDGNSAVDLQPGTRQQMLRAQIRLNDALSWGLGWGLERQVAGRSAGRDEPERKDPNYVWHWGDNGNWKNFVLAHPATRSAIVIFTNGSRGLNVAQRIVTAATGEEHAAFLWL
jgi:CubicO group peptidase (beta-lactamase class C family)